jgi:hypothetical protein
MNLGERVMDQSDQNSDKGKAGQQPSKEPDVVVDSVTLNRLLEEVRNRSSFAPGAYNRVHNRHNR